MKITREEVLKIAKLSRLSLSDAEVGTMTSQLDAILEHVAQLNALDTKDVVPTTGMAQSRTPLRPDVPRPSLSQEVALANAPRPGGGGFLVPKVLEAGGGE
jgi:aspartyl-tRNA(Asn)/glutamyl-tRNA(Gln) amidotransferase subunit C